MKNRDIKKTLKKRHYFTEKRKLESQELQFFMMSADNRKLRVKNGARLFEVLRDQEEVNSQPLQLIETAIPKQRSQTKDNNNPQGLNIPSLKAHIRNKSLMNQKPQQDQHDETQEAPLKGVLLSDYIKDTKFNPSREIAKERNIKDFFQQKYQLVNNYLEDQNDSDVPKLIQSTITTGTMKSRLKQRSLNRAKSTADIQNQSSTSHAATNQKHTLSVANLLKKKSRADQFIEQIEKHVYRQVEGEWQKRYDIAEEHRKIQEEMRRIRENSKKRVQVFIDPRTSKLRQNFQILNSNLSEIRKIDPQLRYLQSATSRSRIPQKEQYQEFIGDLKRQSLNNRHQTSNIKQRTNADILNEILQIGRY